MPSTQIGIRFPDDLLAQLDARGETGDALNRAALVRRDLERYYELMRHARRSLRAKLSPAEVALVADALASTFLDHTSLRHIDHEVEDALLDGLAEKWDVDGAKLVATLRALSDGELFALGDAVERRRLVGGDPKEALNE